MDLYSEKLKVRLLNSFLHFLSLARWSEHFPAIISLNLHVLKEGAELKDFLGSKFRKVKFNKSLYFLSLAWWPERHCRVGAEGKLKAAKRSCLRFPERHHASHRPPPTFTCSTKPTDFGRRHICTSDSCKYICCFYRTLILLIRILFKTTPAEKPLFYETCS